MNTNKRQKKESVPSTILFKEIPGIGTLTQMVTPTPKQKNRSVDSGTSSMVSRKTTTYHRTKLRRIVQQRQPTMTQILKNAPDTVVANEEPFVLTQLSECPTSPSASVIDLLSGSDESSVLSENLLPDGTLTQAKGNTIAHLGPYSSTISHTQLAGKEKNKIHPTKTSCTFDYGSDWDDANPGDLVIAFASDIVHPAFKQGIIGCSYVVLGSVEGFVYQRWDTGMKDENWDGVVQQHERLKVNWLDVKGVSDEDWGVAPAVTQCVKVLAKKGDAKLEGLNIFMKKEIIENFFHTKQSGWDTIKR